MITGGGHSRLEEMMSVTGIPVMTKKCFTKTERDIGEMWGRALNEAMVEAGRMERDIAIQNNSFCEGFTNAEQMHGIRFTKFIGDGDSSVHPTLIQNVPG